MWRRVGSKVLVLIVVVLAAAALVTLLRGAWSLDQLASREADLRASVRTNPLATYSAAFALYVAVTGLSLPGAGLLSLAYGWLFGLVPAIVLLSLSATAGAGCAFLLSRYLIGEYVQRRHGERLTALNQWLDKEGPFYLFWMRLVPTIPFFVINAVMGLTRMRLVTFLWVSQLGMLPGTCLFAYAGSRLPTLREVAAQGATSILSREVILAFVLLGAVPLLVRRLIRRRT